MCGIPGRSPRVSRGVNRKNQDKAPRGICSRQQFLVFIFSSAQGRSPRGEGVRLDLCGRRQTERSSMLALSPTPNRKCRADDTTKGWTFQFHTYDMHVSPMKYDKTSHSTQASKTPHDGENVSGHIRRHNSTKHCLTFQRQNNNPPPFDTDSEWRHQKNAPRGLCHLKQQCPNRRRLRGYR